MEHIISRADLAGTESSPSASPQPDVLEKFRELGQFEFVASNTQTIANVEHRGDGDEEGLEFQLFAAAPNTGGKSGASATGEAQKIRLRSPSLDPERSGFVRPHRSLSYYFADIFSSEEKRRLEDAALTGDQVLAQSKMPWPGSAYAWKVLHIPPSGLSKDLQPAQRTCLARLTGDAQPKKRTRPGKKYRIKLRKKVAASAARKDAKKAAEEAREAAEREKRTRRNREKKIKKKAKEKAKKGSKGWEEGDGDVGDDGSVG